MQFIGPGNIDYIDPWLTILARSRCAHGNGMLDTSKAVSPQDNFGLAQVGGVRPRAAMSRKLCSKPPGE